jgi:hypothetical protein
MSATIKRGDIVRIKPEWQDPGDERFIWRALEDEDGGRVKICATNTGLTFPPNQIVNVSMLEMAQENARVLAQHTPGPFSISGIAGDNYVMAKGPNHDRVIVAIVPGWVGIKPEEHAANMALFRAAPELLAALQNILTANPDLAEVADEARAAIAKATGGAQ